MAVERLSIEVGYVDDDGGQVVTLRVPRGTTLRQALERARLDEHAGIDWHGCRIGIFGELREPDTVLEDGDRVEVYLPLLDDPKVIRRRRAARGRR